MDGIEVHAHTGEGFFPVVDSGGWRVAVFNSADCWKAENIAFVQQHRLTDEVFVLLKGQCTLFVSAEDIPTVLHRVEMKKEHVYNVKKGVWHTHVLGEDTSVLVVENGGTAPENSPKLPLPHPVEQSG